MSDNTTPSDSDLAQARQWLDRWAAVEVGDLPGTDELRAGMTPLAGSWTADMQEWALAILVADDLPRKLRACVQRLADGHSSPESLLDLYERAEKWLREKPGNTAIDIRERVFVYLCAHGRAPAQQALGALSNDWRCGSGAELAFVWVLGAVARRDGIYSPGELVERGHRMLAHAAASTERAMRAIEIARAGDRPSDDDLSVTADDVIQAMAEDRGEIITTPLAQLKPPPPPAVVVVPTRTAEPSRATRDTWKTFDNIAGKRILLARRPDVVAARLELQRRAPHAVEQILTILRDLSSNDVVRLRPTLLVGPPGTGKTALARALGRALGLATSVYPAGGTADSSIMGTSSQWSSARPSVALQLIQQSRIANPLLILDEVDKISPERHNGNLADAVLAMIEPSTARAYRDLSLEVDVDLSHVNWIATANVLEDVPGPLRDRFRVIQVDEPRWEHVSDLARTIFDDIAAERSLDRRWLEELASDELEVLRSAWDGGSIRKLRRALEVLFDGRDALLGRA